MTEVWFCETHGAIGQRVGDDDICDVAQMVTFQLGWPKRCFLLRMELSPARDFYRSTPQDGGRSDQTTKEE